MLKEMCAYVWNIKLNKIICLFFCSDPDPCTLYRVNDPDLYWCQRVHCNLRSNKKNKIRWLMFYETFTRCGWHHMKAWNIKCAIKWCNFLCWARSEQKRAALYHMNRPWPKDRRRVDLLSHWCHIWYISSFKCLYNKTGCVLRKKNFMI